jgi:dipeptidyl aminopeptidase/acylaminoacyl peptidase
VRLSLTLPAVAVALAACSGGGSPPPAALDVSAQPGLVLYRDSIEGAFVAADPEGQRRWRLSVAPGLEAILLADCTPDGSRLAYVVADPASDTSELFLRGAAAPAEPVEVPGLVQSFAWSPEGDRIALALLDAETYRNRLWLLDPDSGGLEELPSGEGSPGPPRWSPDGESLAFSAITQSRSDIYVLRLGDEAPVRLSDRDDSAFDPDWSPDGESLVFSAPAGERAYELFTIGADGGDERQLTDSGTLKSFPRWSADGSRLGYAGAIFSNAPSVSRAAGAMHVLGVWVADADGGGERLLTDLAVDARFLGWCGEGDWLQQGWEPL